MVPQKSMKCICIPIYVYVYPMYMQNESYRRKGERKGLQNI